MLLNSTIRKIIFSSDCIHIKVYTNIFQSELVTTNSIAKKDIKYLNLNENLSINGENYIIINSFLGLVHSFFRNNLLIQSKNFDHSYKQIIIEQITQKNQVDLISSYNFLKSRIIGITIGFIWYIQLKGLGYRSQIKTNQLILRVGLSSLSYFEIPSTIRIKRIKKYTLKIYGIELETFQNACITIKKIREPSPYNNRGLVFKHEIRILKRGKRSKF